MLVACASDANDVPSLGATPTTAVEEEPLDDEEKMMAFTQCMRDEGIELVDTGVDADGNTHNRTDSHYFRDRDAPGVGLNNDSYRAPAPVDSLARL